MPFEHRWVPREWIRWYVDRDGNRVFCERLMFPVTQIQTGNGEVVITNDGATILKHMAVLHPAARMVGCCVLFRVIGR